MRNVFRLIDSLPAFYGVGLALVVFTRDHVRCGDMAAGTLLVYERSGPDALLPEAVAVRVGTLDAAGAEIVADLLQRWPALHAGGARAARAGAADALSGPRRRSQRRR